MTVRCAGGTAMGNQKKSFRIGGGGELKQGNCRANTMGYTEIKICRDLKAGCSVKYCEETLAWKN